MGGGSSKPAPPPPSPLLRQSWRTLSIQTTLNFLKSYQPRNKGVQHLRILLHGPVGDGKSSFVNSVDSALRGRVTDRAETDAATGSSYTLNYKTYRIKKDDQSFCSFVFNDIMGLEGNANNGVQVEDIKLALQGHVKDGYKFRTDSPLTEKDPSYNSNPSLDDKVHVLVCVVPVDSVSLLSGRVLQKLREVRRAARDLGIPQLAMLTRVDEACPEVGSNINNIYKSKYLKGQVEKFSAMLRIPIDSIFLVKNYTSEIYTCDDINRPILTALKQMVNFGEGYLMHINKQGSYFTYMGGGNSKPAPASPPTPAKCPATPPPYPLFSQPWRTLSTQENLNFLKSYQPENKGVKRLRILLHGPVGAGKSSFVNSVDSALRGRVTNRAETDAATGSSFTLKYKTYKIKKDDQSFCSFVFNDIMGLEPNLNNGVQVEDIKLALQGHVRDGYKFCTNSPLTANDLGYNSNPSLDDKVHVLVCVVPVGSVSVLHDKVVQKLKEVRLAASDLGIPQLAMLTKVDEACPEVRSDIHNIYKSKYLKGQVEKFSVTLGIPIKSIFLVKNYESEAETCDDINRPILSALKQMVNFGEDYLNDL